MGIYDRHLEILAILIVCSFVVLFVFKISKGLKKGAKTSLGVINKELKDFHADVKKTETRLSSYDFSPRHKLTNVDKILLKKLDLKEWAGNMITENILKDIKGKDSLFVEEYCFRHVWKTHIPSKELNQKLEELKLEIKSEDILRILAIILRDECLKHV